MMTAAGPGRIAFSHDSPGEVVALPVQSGAAVEVREHTLLVATSSVSYDWVPTNVWFVAPEQGKQESSPGIGLLKMGLEMAGAPGGGRDRADNQPTWHYPVGQYLDRFGAGDQPGLVMVQANGNAYVRDLAAGRVDPDQAARPAFQRPDCRDATDMSSTRLPASSSGAHGATGTCGSAVGPGASGCSRATSASRTLAPTSAASRPTPTTSGPRLPDPVGDLLRRGR